MIWQIWLALAIVSIITIVAAALFAHLIDENFQLKERNGELEAKDLYSAALIHDLTRRVDQARLTCESAQRGWSRTAAPELYSTQVMQAVSVH